MLKQRKKMSLARKGKHFSTETKKKMSEAQTGNKHPLYGKHHSFETKKKMSLAIKSYWSMKKAYEKII